MKISLLQIIMPFLLLSSSFTYAQNIGIGINNPQQKLEVNGAIKIADNNAVAPVKGTMRWNDNKNDFEGFNGFQWVSLTGGRGGVGDTINYALPTHVYDPTLSYTNGNAKPAFGSNIAKWQTNLISGAPYYSGYYVTDGHTFTEAGTVKMFFRHTDGKYWPRANISSPIPGQGFGFGSAIASDDQRFIVGEPRAKVGSIEEQGRAHIFSDPYTVEASLTQNDPVMNDGFGTAVSIKNNFAIVGAPHKTAGGVRRGKVYIYRKYTTTGEWALVQHYLGAASGDEYGAAVAVTDQWMAVGATSTARNGHTNHGAVTMYKLNTATNLWAFHSTVFPNDNDYHGGFGGVITLKGDTMLVTEKRNLSAAKNRIYLFLFSNGSWQQQTEFTVPGSTNDSDVGNATDFSGNKVIIGEQFAHVGEAFYNGKAHLFEWNNNKWNYHTALGPMLKKKSLLFGSSVLLYNNEILCGAIGGNQAYNEAGGLLYIFNAP